MPDLALMAQALAFVEDNLCEPIGVADMAGAVGYSHYHFCRTFNQATHCTPYDYLMRRRLSEAARALLQTEARILDIALDYQFNNPETFSRAFKRTFGQQPSQVRKDGRVDGWRIMPRLTLAHLRHIDRGAWWQPILEEREAFQVAGLMTLVQGDDSVVSDLWNLLGSRPRAAGRDFWGIACYPPDWEQHGYLYLAAFDAQDVDTGDTALVLKAIPPATYAHFCHPGTAGELALTVEYALHIWLPKSGYTLARPWIIEHYGPRLRPAGAQASRLDAARLDAAAISLLLPIV